MINKLPNNNLNLQATSVYDFNELTLQELLCKFFSKINETVDTVNKAYEFWKWVQEQGIAEETKKVIEQMYSDGRLTELINNLFDDVKGQISTIKEEFEVQKTDYINFKNNTNENLTNNNLRLSKMITIEDKIKRPMELTFGYDLSPSKIYKNFLDKLKNSVHDLRIVFVGDSWSAGQGATNQGDALQVTGLVAPSGVTDGFHTVINANMKFVDKIGRAIASIFGLSLRRTTTPVTNTNVFNFQGDWTLATSQSLPEDKNYKSSNTVGNYFTLNSGGKTRCFGLYMLKHANAGKVKIQVRTINENTGLVKKVSDWKSLVSTGCKRSDGVNGDILDLYNSTTDYTQILYITFPYYANWEIKIEVIEEQNSSSGGKICAFGQAILSVNNFINAGKGNHTTLDYCGYKVTGGAGADGSFDQTDHLQEVINQKPCLVIIEPMIINDWFHGVSLRNSYETIQEMFTRLKLSGSDIICLTSATVITNDNVLDYTQNSEYTNKPPLVNNLHNLGTYEDYLENVKLACYNEQIPLLNSYEYFMEEFNKTTHQNWTIGESAGRIHVNDYGHNLLYELFINKSNLFRPQTYLK